MFRAEADDERCTQTLQRVHENNRVAGSSWHYTVEVTTAILLFQPRTGTFVCHNNLMMRRRHGM